jgi:hypothetical protein
MHMDRSMCVSAVGRLCPGSNIRKFRTERKPGAKYPGHRQDLNSECPACHRVT